MTQKSARISFLLVLALATDLLTPLLIWKGILPAQLRWLSHAAIATMIPLVYLHMMFVARVPKAVFATLFLLSVGVTVALTQGQSLLSTAWGCWVVFQFPIVGLFAYLWPRWPDRMADHLCSFCIAVLGFQVIVQMAQYVTGEAPGDNLAGLFGERGTGNLVLFIIFAYCVGLGRWLASERWQSAVLIATLGGVSSAFGEMKLFPPVAILLSILAFTMCLMRRRSFVRLLPSASIVAGAVLFSVIAYERVIVGGGFSDRSLFDYLHKETREQYLTLKPRTDTGYMGRSFALGHGWDTIQQDASSLIFGFGLGARSESRSLGTIGEGLQREGFRLASGTGLLVMIHETGLLGLLMLSILTIWLVVTLINEIRQSPQSNALQLRYALLLFSLLWPLWLYYNQALTLRVPMLLYWASLGYVLGEFEREQTNAGDRRSGDSCVRGGNA
jgi:hypothetical protein